MLGSDMTTVMVALQSVPEASQSVGFGIKPENLAKLVGYVVSSLDENFTPAVELFFLDGGTSHSKRLSYGFQTVQRLHSG